MAPEKPETPTSAPATPAPEAPKAAPPTPSAPAPETSEAPQATEKKSAARRRPKAPATAAPAAAGAKPERKKSEGPKPPRRPTLEPELARLLHVRAEVGARRPKFVRTASHRYFRIGRWESWRSAKGLQSKQRRHYGYRPVVVSIGFGSPRRTRGLTPTGFRPVVVRTAGEIEKLDRTTDAAIIARTVGTRRRLALEETARKLGLHVLNPISKESRED